MFRISPSDGIDSSHPVIPRLPVSCTRRIRRESVEQRPSQQEAPNCIRVGHLAAAKGNESCGFGVVRFATGREVRQ
jgi:hypothetical protein